MLRRPLLVGAVIVVATTAIHGQWLNYRDPRIPRTKDGKVNLAAPTPRLNGKPDLSGVWKADFRYFADIAADGVKVPFQPWAETVYRERQGNGRIDHPRAQCLPIGMPQMLASPFPIKFIQNSQALILLYEAENVFRQVFLDGRAVPDGAEPTWRGYSTAKWDRDSLVVTTTGFNGKSWLDYAGRPETDALRLTERYFRRDFGHMNLRITIDDPKAYTAPWMVSEEYVYLPDADLLEEVCLENEKSREHMVRP